MEAILIEIRQVVGLLSLILGLAAQGCCEETASYPRYHFYELYAVLDLERVSIGSNASEIYETRPAPSASSGYFAVGPLEGRTWAEIDRINLVVRNRSMSVVALDWPSANWIDEQGGAHSLELIPNEDLEPTSLHPTVIQPGETARISLTADSKRYRINYRCTEDADYREPLVPFVYRNRSEAAVRRSMQEMLSTTTRVHIEVPLSEAGESRAMRFSWRVRTMLDLDEPPSDWGVFRK